MDLTLLKIRQKEENKELYARYRAEAEQMRQRHREERRALKETLK